MEADTAIIGSRLAVFAELMANAATFNPWWQATADELGLFAHPEVGPILNAANVDHPFAGVPALWPSVVDATAWKRILAGGATSEPTPRAARIQWRRAWDEFCSGPELIHLLCNDPNVDLPRTFLKARVGLLVPTQAVNAKSLRVAAQIAAGRWRIVRGEPEHPDARRYEAHSHPLADEVIALAQRPRRSSGKP